MSQMEFAKYVGSSITRLRLFKEMERSAKSKGIVKEFIRVPVRELHVA